MKTKLVKRIQLLLFIGLLGATSLVTGCKDNAVEPAANTITEEDAADIIAASLGSSDATTGLAAQAADAATISASGSITSPSTEAAEKGNATLGETTVIKSKSTGLYTYNYTFKFTYNQTSANTMSFGYKMNGVYDTPRMSSSDSANAAWTVVSSDSVGSATGTATVNGNYNRDGSQTSKVRNKNVFTSKVTMTLTSLVVDKATRVIQSGTANVTVTGNNTNGRSFSYTATIVFNGNQSATLNFGSRQFVINISTAEANAKP